MADKNILIKIDTQTASLKELQAELVRISQLTENISKKNLSQLFNVSKEAKELFEYRSELEKILKLGDALRLELQLEISELDINDSKFFKKVYMNTPRIIGRKR